MDSLHRMIEVQKSLGTVTKDVDYGQIIDTSFLAADIQAIIKWPTKGGSARDVEAAIDVERFAGDVAGHVATQEGDGVGHLIGPAETLHRRSLQ